MHFVKYRQYSHIENNKQVSPVHLGMNLGKSNVSNRKGSAWLPAEKAKIHEMSLEAEQVTDLFGIPKGCVNYSGLENNTSIGKNSGSQNDRSTLVFFCPGQDHKLHKVKDYGTKKNWMTDPHQILCFDVQ